MKKILKRIFFGLLIIGVLLAGWIAFVKSLCRFVVNK